MVHEGFTTLTGRTILIRTDDLTPQERADVSEFFRLVARLKYLGELSGGWFVSVGISGAIATALLVLVSTPATICAGALTIIGATTAYVAANAHVRVGTSEVHNLMLGIVHHNERCRIAALQLRQTPVWYAKLLPEIPAQPVAS